MKKFTGFVLLLTMLMSMFAGLPAFAESTDSDAEIHTVFEQTYEDNCSSQDMLTAFAGSATVVTEEGTANKVIDLKTASSSDTLIGISNSSSNSNIKSDTFVIEFDVRAIVPVSGLGITIKNPYFSSLSGFESGFTYYLSAGNFIVDGNADSMENDVYDTSWYTYRLTVDASLYRSGLTLTSGDTNIVAAEYKSRGDDEFITITQNNSFSQFGSRLMLGSSYVPESAPDGISFIVNRSTRRPAGDTNPFEPAEYMLDNIKVYYEEAPELTAITNIVMQLGSSLTERNFTWFSTNASTGYISYAKADELIDGKLPSTANKVVATRDGSGTSLKANYYNNKATITGLEPGETYCYQLSNGTDTSDLFSFTVGDRSSSFSFAYIGDAQIGAGSLGVTQNGLDWERTLNQLTFDPAFEGIDFMASAGDQINTNTSNPNYSDNEAQYDAYLNHPQFTGLAQTSLLGNHDGWSQGGHYQHFNEPNYIIDPATGNYYGVKKYGSYINSADSWFTYNSVLFIALNLHDISSAANAATDAGRAADKATYAKHLEFIDKVLEINKDNSDILWKVLIYHESPYGSSYHGNYTLDSNNTYTARNEQYTFVNLREYLLPGVYERDFDVILSGHDHCYTRTHILKHEATDTKGMYYGNEIITPYSNTSGSNYYTYENGSTTPTFVQWADANGKIHTDKKVQYKPIKVTDPDGVLHITASSSSGSQCNAVDFVHPVAAATVGHTSTIKRQAMRIDVTPTTMTFTNYGLGNSTADVNPLENVLDTFTIEKTAKVAVKGVSLPGKATIPVGQTETLTAELTPASPSNSGLLWASDNTAVATVENGVVTAKAAGTAKITVTTADGGYTATCTVTVIDATAVTGVTLDNTALELSIGDIKTLYATISPEAATTKDVSWSSSDEAVATVSANGSVTALALGTATITVTTKDGGKTATCAVTVKAVPATAVELDASSVTMTVTEEKALTATVYPSNATYQTISWTSSDSSIVSVDESGTLKALKLGTATVTATNPDDKSAKCTVTVTGGILLKQDFESTTNKTFYSRPVTGSSDTSWSRVQDSDGNWVLKLNGSGILATYISGTWPTAQTIDMSVPHYTDFTISFDICRTSEKGYRTVNFSFFTEESTNRVVSVDTNSFTTGEWYDVKVVYDSSSASFTTYYKKKADATYTQIASAAGKNPTSGTNKLHFALLKDSYASTEDDIRSTEMLFDNIEFYVDVPVTGVSLNKSSETLFKGDTLTLSSTIAPSNATDTHIAYTTSDASIATVTAGGVVSAVGRGTATITVTAAGEAKTAICTVTVKDTALSLTRNGWKFVVGTDSDISDGIVYVGAYDSRDSLIGLGSADFSTPTATEVTMTEPSSTASYFKAFVWDANQTPLIEGTRLDN